MSELFAMTLADDADIIAARQAARRVALFLGFEPQDSVRIATAVSEIARASVEQGSGGRCRLRLAADTAPAALEIDISSRAPAVPGDLPMLAAAPTDSIGMSGAKRLMEDFVVEALPDGGALIRMSKALPDNRLAPDAARLRDFARSIARERPVDLIQELQDQNRELLLALAEVKRQHEELAQLNEELQDTNRGVVALYAELDERAEQLRRANEMKTRFLSNMSHEFRTPLNSILALSRLLRDRMDGDLSPEQDKQIGLISTSATNLTEIVNDLLDIAKVESGKAFIRASTFSVADVFAALRGMLRPLLTADRVALVFDDPVDVPALHTDEGKVAQILRNFISNALKFTETGEVRVHAAKADAGRAIAFAVSDTGIGIAAEHHATIFEEFAQIESPIQGRVRGTGLGLPLSRQLARLLGGAVDVVSTPGVGSTFRLQIPVHIGASEIAGDAAPVVAAFCAAGSGQATLLVIDDDPTARYLVRQCAAAYAVTIVEAVDGTSGLHDALALAPSAIVLDINMPGLDGLSVFEALAAHSTTAGVPIMIATSADLGPAQRARLAGATTILSKGDLNRQAMAVFLDTVGIGRKEGRT